MSYQIKVMVGISYPEIETRLNKVCEEKGLMVHSFQVMQFDQANAFVRVMFLLEPKHDINHTYINLNMPAQTDQKETKDD